MSEPPAFAPPPMQVPLTAKQPVAISMPLRRVEVAILVTRRFASVVVPAERLPEKVDVEFVPATLKKPKVEVAVVVVAVKYPESVSPATENRA